MTRRRVAAWVAVLAVCLAANAGWRWWHNRPPYGPQALAATASLEFVTEQAAQAALGDGVHAPPTGPGDQLTLGRVSWRLPPTPQPGGAF